MVIKDEHNHCIILKSLSVYKFHVLYHMSFQTLKKIKNLFKLFF